MDNDTLKKFGVTEEQLDAWEKDASLGIFHGEPRKIVMGRPHITNEPLRAITITLPESMVKSIDMRSNNRSEFIRNALASSLQ